MHRDHDNGPCEKGNHVVSVTGLAGHRPPPWDFLAETGTSLGLAGIGVAPALPVPGQVGETYEHWLAAGFHADLGYARRNLAERLDPRRPRIHPRSAAVISVALPYGSGSPVEGIWRYVAAHARGRDYHLSVRRVLWAVDREVRRRFPSARTRRLVDTAPVMERWWAAASGLGFIGRHGGLVIPGYGARVSLGELIVADVPAPVAGPVTERFQGCGDCRACLDACPTGALVEPGLVDCRRCLSYHTVENPAGPVPPHVGRTMTMLFGCDRCTETCPLEVGIACALEPPPDPGPADLDPAGLAALPDAAIAALIRGTALERSGVNAIRRNAALVAEHDRTTRMKGCHAPASVG